MKNTTITKKIIAFAAMAGLMMNFTGCIVEQGHPEGSSKTAAKNPYIVRSDVQLATYEECPVDVKVDVIWNRKINVKLTNNGKKSYLWGNPSRLEYLYDGEWYKVPARPDMAWTLEGIVLDHGENNTGESTVRLDWVYGDIPAGHYRFIKDLSYPVGGISQTDYYVAGEFDLAEATDEKEPLYKTKIDSSLIVSQEQAAFKLDSLKFEDKSSLGMKYSSRYTVTERALEFQKDGDWYVIPTTEGGFEGEYGLGEEELNCYNVILNPEYSLEPGHYRLVFTAYTNAAKTEDIEMTFVIQEFDLDKENNIIVNR